MSERIIIKRTINSDGGHGIQFVDNCKDEQSLLESVLRDESECVIQTIIKQHSTLASFNPNSINTIRIMTLFWNEHVQILSSVLRMGVNGSKVDNASSGGMVCGVDNDGKLKEYAFDASANKFQEHPQGSSFKGIEIPSFSLCKDIAIKAAYRFLDYTKLISWDFAIDENSNPILIEANLTGGQLDFHQLCNGPIWGNMTNDILSHIFSQSKDVKQALNY